jgi:signal transduction histidine kinase
MVHDVLDFARLERGRYRLQPRRVPVRRLVATAVRASRDAVRLGGQRLLVAAPRGLPELCVDVEVLARALRNLIDNAAKQAPAGSVIELEVAGTGRGPERGNSVAFAVRDTGPGLGGVDVATLFEPFRKGTGAGSGLGLAIVDRAVRAHGGRVRVAERPGGGAEFRIDLPDTGGAA